MDITCNSLLPESHGGASLSARTTAFLTGNVHKPHHLFRQIPLTKGRFTKVDAEDYEWLNQWKWYAAEKPNSWYVARQISTDGKKSQCYMHRVIIDVKTGMQVDHIDGDGLNNQKSNLRICTNAQNQMNKRMLKANTSGFRGVYWNKAAKKWRARLKFDGRGIHLGFFTCLIKAAVAYDKAAIKYFGEFARLNFPELKRN